MRILILGSEGFIGQQVVKLAISEAHHVYGVDLINKTTFEYFYSKLSLLSSDFDLFLSAETFDVIINCSGSGNVSFSLESPLTDFDLNTRSIVIILEAVRKYQRKAKYIHVSSAAVYGNPQTLPISETAPLQPVSPYGYHKWISELVCKEYEALYGLRIAIVRPFSIYGPGLKKQLLWDIFQKANSQDEIVLWGTGEETRDFLFIEDAAKALLKIGTDSNDKFGIYNLAFGQSVTIKCVADLMLESLGWKKKIFFNGVVKEGNPRFWEADISAIRAKGFQPSIALFEGIKLTTHWLLACRTSH
jgi:nucleoside-diphosphate-sugar epimerase